MRIEQEIVQHLAADGDVAALATGGVWLTLVPQHVTAPTVRVLLVDEPKRRHLRGGSVVTRARVQIDAFATEGISVDPSGTVADVADAVEAALGPAPFRTGGSPALEVLVAERVDRRPFEPEEGPALVYRMLQDFQITYRDR